MEKFINEKFFEKKIWRKRGNISRSFDTSLYNFKIYILFLAYVCIKNISGDEYTSISQQKRWTVEYSTRNVTISRWILFGALCSIGVRATYMRVKLWLFSEVLYSSAIATLMQEHDARKFKSNDRAGGIDRLDPWMMADVARPHNA